MFEFDSMIVRQRKGMLTLLALVVLGVVFLPYMRELNGLLLGGVISFYNLLVLQRKTRLLGDKAATKSKFRGSLGTVTRMAAAVLGVAIAMRFEESFHVIAVVIGLMLSYLIIFLDGIYYLLIRKNQDS
ncbi:ATP synthase subunit I [Oceanobacillus luteolus]|uniref:ATP synthase subunit I n=1 Tax=Oceanobacillus luteolus TaxID=1274358 RepID=A0ABW4HLQ0_9BACI|nr:ATP synthase subunit I [Oceanobacillus luteolus]MCM3741659.1 ATP synthase subunit I [Oceanobacillus luteolus]